MPANATTAPRKRGRPKKIDPRDAYIAELEAQVAAAPSAPTTNPQELQPGEYFELLHGEVRKKRWTRADIERLYPKVSLVVSEPMVVSPNGIQFRLRASEEPIEVPSCVAEAYRAVKAARLEHNQMYKPWSSQEKEDLSSLAMATNDQVWSRVARIGTGFSNLGPDADPSSAA